MRSFILVRAISNNLIASAVALVCGLSFAPIFFRMLGAEEFGVFGVAQVFIGVYSLLEFGAGAYVVRELAKSLEVDDYGQAAKAIVCFGFIFSVFSSFVAAVLLMLTALPILDIWQPGLHNALSNIELFVAVLLFLTLFQAFLGSIFSGCQMQNVTAWFNACTWILRILLGWGFLTWQTPSAGALLASQILAITLVISVQLFSVCSLLKKRAVLPDNIEILKSIRSVFRAYLQFGASFFPGNFFGFLIINLDRIVLMRGLSKSEFGYFTVARNLVNSMFALAQSLASYGYPAFASSLNDRDELRRTFFYLQFAMTLLFLPSIICLLSAPDQFMAIYSGGIVSGERIAWYLMFLLMGAVFTMTGMFANILVIASGNERSYFFGSFLSLIIMAFGWGIFEMSGSVKNFLIVAALSAIASTMVSLYVVERKIFPKLILTLLLPGWLLPWLIASGIFLFVRSVMTSSWLVVGIMLISSLIASFLPNYLILHIAKHQRV